MLTGLQAFLEQMFNVIQGLGPWAPWAFILFYFLGSIFFISNPLMFLAAGVLFGVPLGFVLVSVSSVSSAAAVFLAGRYWSRGWLLKKIVRNENIVALDDAVSRKGWTLVFLLRFTAILPFSVMNYALGLSKIRFRDYVLASWLGMMPGIFLYVYLGSLAGKKIFHDAAMPKNPLEWAFFALSLGVTAGISVYAAIVVKKILKSGKHPKK